MHVVSLHILKLIKKIMMMLFDKFNETFDRGDIVGVAECFHEDMQMTMHSNGSSISKQEWLDRFGPMLDKLKREKVRCLYENEDLLVTHSFITFPNGSCEAVIWVGLKRDGLIVSVETGSTPISN